MSQQKVLVVDDDREIVRAISKLLQHEGITTLSAYNGREAVDILSDDEVHLIILDIMMPELDGISATIKIRDEKNIPISCSPQKRRRATRYWGFPWGLTIT